VEKVHLVIPFAVTACCHLVYRTLHTPSRPAHTSRYPVTIAASAVPDLTRVQPPRGKAQALTKAAAATAVAVQAAA